MVGLCHEREVCERKTIRDIVDVDPIIPIKKNFWITEETLSEYYPRDVGWQESYWKNIYYYIIASEGDAIKARDLIYAERTKQGWKKDSGTSLKRRIGDTKYSIVLTISKTQGAVDPKFWVILKLVIKISSKIFEREFNKK